MSLRLRPSKTLRSSLGIAQRRWAARRAVQAGHAPAAEAGTACPAQQLPRFYVEQRLGGATVGQLVRLAEEEARHATRTLRLRQGDRLELCDGRGVVAVAELESTEARRGAVARTVADAVQLPLEPWQWVVAVACGSLKGGRSDWLVEKLAELGAAALLPLRTERSPLIGSEDQALTASSSGSSARDGKRQRRGRQSQEDGGLGDDEAVGGSGREGRWARVATAAMKQCRRAHAMVVLPPADVGALCARIAAADVVLVGVAGAPPLRHQLAACSASATGPGPGSMRGLLVVGPEGDFTPEEQAVMLAAGALPVGLGPLRLRAETAAVSMLSYVRLLQDGG